MESSPNSSKPIISSKLQSTSAVILDTILSFLNPFEKYELGYTCKRLLKLMNQIVEIPINNEPNSSYSYKNIFRLLVSMLKIYESFDYDRDLLNDMKFSFNYLLVNNLSNLESSIDDKNQYQLRSKALSMFLKSISKKGFLGVQDITFKNITEVKHFIDFVKESESNQNIKFKIDIVDALLKDNEINNYISPLIESHQKFNVEYGPNILRYLISINKPFPFPADNISFIREFEMLPQFMTYNSINKDLVKKVILKEEENLLANNVNSIETIRLFHRPTKARRGAALNINSIREDSKAIIKRIHPKKLEIESDYSNRNGLIDIINFDLIEELRLGTISKDSSMFSILKNILGKMTKLRRIDCFFNSNNSGAGFLNLNTLTNKNIFESAPNLINLEILHVYVKKDTKIYEKIIKFPNLKDLKVEDDESKSFSESNTLIHFGALELSKFKQLGNWFEVACFVNENRLKEGLKEDRGQFEFDIKGITLENAEKFLSFLYKKNKTYLLEKIKKIKVFAFLTEFTFDAQAYLKELKEYQSTKQDSKKEFNPAKGLHSLSYIRIPNDAQKLFNFFKIGQKDISTRLIFFDYDRLVYSAQLKILLLFNPITLYVKLKSVNAFKDMLEDLVQINSLKILFLESEEKEKLTQEINEFKLNQEKLKKEGKKFFKFRIMLTSAQFKKLNLRYTPYLDY